MNAVQLLKDQVKQSREALVGTLGEMTDEQLHMDPGGKALPVGAIYAHLIISEDRIISGMLQGKPSLDSGEWKGKTGIDQEMPSWEKPDWEKNHLEWAKSVKVDISQLKEYEKVVNAATDEYINNLNDGDLDREIDLGEWGKNTVAGILGGLIVGHTNNLVGEISATKGIQGLKGYPF